MLLAVLALWYFRLYVAPPIAAGYGFYVGGGGHRDGDGAVGAGHGRRVVGGEQAPMTGFVEPVVLTGPRWVTLEPLRTDARRGDRGGVGRR